MTGRFKRPGWHGNSYGHSLAARGMKLYSKKLMDPIFYAAKREEALPFAEINKMVREGYTLNQILAKHPEVDKEDVRKRGIKALGDSTLAMIDEQGVDATILVAGLNMKTEQRVRDVLYDQQKASFLPKVKVELLKKRLEELK